MLTKTSNDVILESQEVFFLPPNKTHYMLPKEHKTEFCNKPGTRFDIDIRLALLFFVLVNLLSLGTTTFSMFLSHVFCYRVFIKTCITVFLLLSPLPLFSLPSIKLPVCEPQNLISPSLYLARPPLETFSECLTKINHQLLDM